MKTNGFRNTALVAALAAISSAAWAGGNVPAVVAQAQQAPHQTPTQPVQREQTQRAVPGQDAQRTPQTQQTRQTTGTTQRAQQAQPAPQVVQVPGAQGAGGRMDMRASQLIGKGLRNAQGEDVGTIEELMVDVNNQRVHYAVVAFGGILGLGEKLFAYPVRSLQVNGDQVVLNVPRERLQDAPGFARNLWPDWGNDRYEEAVDSYHGADVSLERRNNMNLVRASELMGKDVNDRHGDTVADIDDVVVDLQSAEVRYVVLDFDRGRSQGNSMVALPLDALSMPDGRDGDAVIHAPRQLVNMAQGFDKDNWPNVNDPQFRNRIDEQLPAYRPWTTEGERRSQGQTRQQTGQQTQPRMGQPTGQQTPAQTGQRTAQQAQQLPGQATTGQAQQRTGQQAQQDPQRQQQRWPPSQQQSQQQAQQRP